MLTEERHDRIRQQLSENGKVLAVDLAAQFEVSEDTIRRDLRELAKAGYCRRVYGGALMPAPDLGPLTARITEASDSKARLAQIAAGLIQDRQTVFIDAGSTNLAIAKAIPHSRTLTVVTNAPSVATALADHPNCTIIVLGGVFDRFKGACLGSQTVHETRQIYADLFIIGACGIDANMGITALDAAEADIKRTMLAQSSTVLVAATADKLGTIAPFKIADAAAIDHLVVDNTTPTETLAALRALDIQLHVTRI